MAGGTGKRAAARPFYAEGTPWRFTLCDDPRRIIAAHPSRSPLLLGVAGGVHQLEADGTDPVELVPAEPTQVDVTEELRVYRQKHRDLEAPDPWCWMGDGNDHLESFCAGAAILIRAEDLRTLLEEAAK